MEAIRFFITTKTRRGCRCGPAIRCSVGTHRNALTVTVNDACVASNDDEHDAEAWRWAGGQGRPRRGAAKGSAIIRAQRTHIGLEELGVLCELLGELLCCLLHARLRGLAKTKLADVSHPQSRSVTYLLDGHIGGLLAGGLAGLGGVSELGIDVLVDGFVDLSSSVKTG